MNVVFRVDASVEIGTGHVMRCLTLAQALGPKARCKFICREHPGDLLALIRGSGFAASNLPPGECREAPVSRLPGHLHWLGSDPLTDARQTLACIDEPADWLVVDHYALDATWERAVRGACRRILAIDDLADRSHDCEILLDQNFHQNGGESRYAQRVPEHCRQLLGPCYALLRPEFAAERSQLRVRCGQIQRVMVYFGGTDSANMTARALDALSRPGLQRLEVDVVMGLNNAHRVMLEEMVRSRGSTQFHTNMERISRLMARVDLAIGAGGISTWERLCLGLVNVTTAVAENQVEAMESLASAGYIKYLGTPASATAGAIAQAVGACRDNPGEMAEMSRAGMALVDGNGAARVARLLREVACLD